MTFVQSAVVPVIEIDRQSMSSEELSFTVSGGHMPIVELHLSPGQGVICRAAGLMRSDPGIEILPWDGAVDQIMLAVNNRGSGPSGLMLSAMMAGQAGVFDLAQHGGYLLCPPAALLAAGPGVNVEIYSHYRQIEPDGYDLLMLEGDGKVFLRASGDVKEARLAAGKQTRINIDALAAMSATVDFDPLGKADPDTAIAFARLTGPGQVWLQSGVLRD